MGAHSFSTNVLARERNLFYQPLDGSKPTQLTHFNSEPLWVAAYAVSPDGKQIAITRAKVNDSDLIMFINFQWVFGCELLAGLLRVNLFRSLQRVRLFGQLIRP
jgi:hypothetical protein